MMDPVGDRTESLFNRVNRLGKRFSGSRCSSDSSVAVRLVLLCIFSLKNKSGH